MAYGTELMPFRDVGPDHWSAVSSCQARGLYSVELNLQGRSCRLPIFSADGMRHQGKSRHLCCCPSEHCTTVRELQTAILYIVIYQQNSSLTNYVHKILTRFSLSWALIARDYCMMRKYTVCSITIPPGNLLSFSVLLNWLLNAAIKLIQFWEKYLSRAKNIFYVGVYWPLQQ